MLTKKIGLIFIVILLNMDCGVAQLSPSSESVRQQVETELPTFKKAFPDAKISQSSATGLPTSITGLSKVNPDRLDLLGSNVTDAVTKFLTSATVKALFPAALSDSRSTLVEVERHVNPLSPTRTIVTVRQMIGGLPVYGGEAHLEVAPGQLKPSAQPSLKTPVPNETASFAISDVKANFFTLTNDVNTVASVPASEAGQLTEKAYAGILLSSPQIKAVERSLYGGEQKPTSPQLVMFDPSALGEQTYGLRPTWIVKQGSYVFFFDANSGLLIHRYRDLHQLAAFQVQDYALSVSGPVLVQNENGPLPGASAPTEAANAIANATAARNFFKPLNMELLPSSSPCDSFLTSPSLVNLNIRYTGTETSYWVPALNAAFFAEGFANAPDVVAHELTHGITNFTSCITNDFDPGAVSEFYSDFFAAMLRQQNGMSPWTIGDSLPQFTPPSPPIRNMSNPHQPGFNPALPYATDNRGQPEIFSEKVTAASAICDTDQDNHCAHINSGILNKAAYLMIAGGTFGGITISGIGFQKAAKIIDRSLQTLNSLPTFSQTAQNIVSACNAEVADNDGGISSNNCTSVQQAFQAVGIN